MFGKQFYPTPQPLIKKMVEDVKVDTFDSIFDPSAGKGDILKYIQDNHLHYNTETRLMAGEIDENLRTILRKEYPVISSDFLTFSTFQNFGLIIMNPPFLEGAKHLLKALEMQRNGGSIVCILNAETIRNPYTNERKELITRLEETSHHTIEYLTGEFLDAERKTSVEVALIKIFNEPKRQSYFQEKFEKAQKVEEYKNSQKYFEVAENDYISAFVKQFELEANAGIALINEYKSLLPILNSQLPTKNPNGKIETKGHPLIYLTHDRLSHSDLVSENKFLQDLRLKYWEGLFSHNKFMGKLTTNLANTLRAEVRKYADYDFNYSNIKELQIEMSGNIYQGLEDTLIEEFDNLSAKFSFNDFSKNIHYYNGWKSNKAHFVNKKVVSINGGWGTGWGNYIKHSDVDKNNVPYYLFNGFEYLANLDKALSYLDDDKSSRKNFRELFDEAQYSLESRNRTFNYFKVSFFKKGTIHITFTNNDILKKFNIFVGQRKNWLPPTYGTKNYSDLTEEEQAVIDSFEGKESYEEVYHNQDKFLVQTTNILSLENTTHQ